MKKKFTLLMMLAFLGLSIGALRAQGTTNWGGTGASDNPYTISNAAGLVELATNVNAGTTYADSYFKLTDDIDLSSVCGPSKGNWTPIGTSSHPFSGIFDGDGKTISNLYINEPTKNNQGLFGYAVGAEFKDFAIADFYINFMRNGGALCAEFINASDNKGIISGCSCMGTIKSEIGHTGALCGDVNYAIIQDCSTGSGTKVMSNVSSCGGLIGWCQNSDLTGCSNYATVTYNEGSSSLSIGGANFGGICGRTDGGSFTSCVNYGTVDFSDDQYGFFNIGGISGDTEVSVTEFTSCENRGKISGHHMLGGIVGSGNLVIESCTNYGEITAVKGAVSEGLSLVGGICGALATVIDEHSSPVLYNCSNESTGTITADGYALVGGIIGALVDSKSTSSTAYHEIYMIESCSNAANVTGADYVGGVVGVYGHMGGEIGINNHRIINNCSNSGPVTGNGFIGGICGGDSYATLGVISIGGKIANCENTGKVTTIVTSYSNGGGIIADGNKIVVENCTNSGEIEGFQIVGGICGKLKDSEVTACQNSGAVTGNYAGGIVGDGEIIEVANCTNLGEIDGAQSVGGITGMLASGTISSSFNTGDIEFNGSGAATVGGGIVGSVVSLSPDAVGSTIQCCYNMGNIKSNSISESERVFLGGIVGILEVDGSDISNCYNSGVLSSVEVSEGVAVCIGGIISYISDNVAVTLTNSYNVGNFVYPNATVLVLGGVAAAVVGRITISDCFYDQQMCPVVNEFCPDDDGTPLLTSDMTNGSWIPDGSAFTVSNGLYPQLTVFSASSNDLTKAASIVSVTPAFLNGVENVEGVATSPFTVGTGNSVSWSAASPFSYDEGEGEVSFSTEGTGTLTVSKTVSDITVSKDIVMTTIIEDVCWAGSGTEADPYRIEDAAGLVCLAEKVNAGEHYAGVYFKMKNNIDLSSVCGSSKGNWTPIGTSSHPFKGVFDGDGKTISHLYINAPEASDQGLFGYVYSATIKNVIIAADGQIVGDNNVGGLVAKVVDSDPYSTIIGCVNNADVSGKSHVGGIVGWIYGNVENCTNNGTVSSVSGEGGAGSKDGGGGSTRCIGGVLGYYEDGIVTGCTNTGNVVAEGANMVGGIAGLMKGAGLIVGCNNSGNVTGYDEVGGIVGASGRKSYADCTNSGNVTGNKYVGGICSSQGAINAEEGYAMYECHNTGTITGNEFIGGLSGWSGFDDSKGDDPLEYPNRISDCSNSGEIVLQNALKVAGGLMGEACFVSFSDCTNEGTVRYQGTQQMKEGTIAGICGDGDCVTFIGCSNKGLINGNNDLYVVGGDVGGIIGRMSESDELGLDSRIENCTNQGQVLGAASGGIVSNLRDGLVVGCSNTAEIEGGFAGGIFAMAEEHSLVENCQNSGHIVGRSIVIASDPIKGIAGGIGGLLDDAEVRNCYNTGAVQGQSPHSAFSLEAFFNDPEPYSCAGGIVGGNVGQIVLCYNMGSVSEAEYNGGMCGTSLGSISQCYNLGTVEGNDIFGVAAGIAGFVDNDVSDCYNAGIVKGTGVAGGIVGLVSESVMSDCYNIGYVSAEEVIPYDDPLPVDCAGGIAGLLFPEGDLNMTNCYYDKQMCPLEYVYCYLDEVERDFVGHEADGNNLLTEAMVGDGLLAALGTEYWVYNDAYPLYPQLRAFAESANEQDVTASLVSATPAFLANGENVEGVATNFTVGTNGVAWSHVSGNEVLAFSGANVSVTGAGTEMVAVSKDGVSKYIQMTTAASPAELTWVDVVTSEPDGFAFDDIDSPEDLAWFISCVNGFNGCEVHANAGANITADIDMSAHYWVPIGFVKESTSKSDDYVVFGGNFNGMFRSISGIRIDSDVLKDRFHAGSALCLGMFGKTNNARIMNVILTGGSIQANLDDVVGGLVGEQTGGRIGYSEAAVDITGHDALMGGLVGRAQQGSKDSNTTNIYNSFSASTITGNGIIGGLVAELGTNCCLYSAYSSTKFNYSAGSGKSELMGGLVGDNKGRVGGCYVRPISGSVQSESFGTLAGNNDGVFVDCFVPKNGFGTSGFMASGSGSCTYIGTFTDAQYPFTYTQTENCVIEQVTESNPSFPVVPVVGTTTLVNALNNWVLRNMMSSEWDINPDPDWGCFGCNINGNYPVHCYYDWSNIHQTDISRPMAVSTVNGNVLYYHQYLSDAVKKYNALDGGGIIGVWGSEDMKGKDGQENDEDVQIYLNPVTCMSDEYSSYIPGMSCFGSNAGKNADDWYVSLLQDEEKKLTVHDGINWDNSCGHAHASDGTELFYDWHLFSSPVSAPTGINYTDQTTSYNHWTGHDSPEYGFMEGVDGYFPEDTDYGKFDLYAWSEKDYHWINLKSNSASHWHQDGAHEQIEYTNETRMVPGKGYMMALDKKMLLQSHGVLNNGHIEIPVTAEGEFLTGYNLLGNPYQSSLDFNLFAANENNASLWPSEGYTPSYLVYNADKDCYEAYAVGTSASDATAPRYLWPHQGFYVLCGEAAAGSKAHFENDMRVILYNAGGYDTYFRGDETPSYPLVNMFLKDSNGSGDVLVVELDRPELGGAEKMRDVKAGKGILYAHYAGNDYSILFAQGHVSEVPVHFVADESGEFTIMMNTQNGTFSYLHLIDNLTGCDVDMLTNSEYRFTSSTSDYASRFKLVFEYTGVEEDIDSDADGTFAFQMGEQIVVNGEGTLEIVDVQGRILRSERLSGVQSVVVPSVAKGLYLLRLSGSDSVKVQKIVIK